MKSDKDIELEIQKTLMSIYELTLNINNELEVINSYTKKDGNLRTAVLGANEKLTAAAINAKIDVTKILPDNQNENQNNESRYDLVNGRLTEIFHRKIMSVLNDA